MKEEVDGFAYVAIRPCGCLCWACVDCTEMKASIAKEMPKMIRAGYTVERWECERVRKAKFGLGKGHDCRVAA